MLEATDLMHEAYLRLVGVAEPRVYRDRRHFFAAAATGMRQILVDQSPAQADRKARGRAAAPGGRFPLTNYRHRPGRENCNLKTSCCLMEPWADVWQVTVT